MESEMANRNALTKGYDIQNQFAPEKNRLANEYAGLQNKFYAPNMQSEINSRNALTNRTNTMLPLEAKELQQKNAFYPERTRAEINQMNELAKYRAMGGAGINSGGRDELLYQKNVELDNPQLKTDEQKREAADVYAKGGNQLSDGTQLNPLSDATRRSLDRAIKSTTSAKLVTSGVQANQADAELKALNEHVNPVIKDVGTTYFNKSIDTLMASLSDKPKDQEKLGRIIGARSLQYAIAQLRNRIDMGEPGINATKELMSHSGQTIDFIAPKISPEAREAASKYIDEGVQKALKARNKFGIGASSATGNNPANNQKSESNNDPWGIR
jgi:hypothetical protein